LAALDPTVTQFALTQAEADKANAAAQFANASATATRQQALFATNAVSQAQLDNAVAARDTATARLTQAEAALQKARDQIGYTELDADFAGVITAWSAEVGQVVSAGQAVVTLARPDVKEAVVDIPDTLIGEVAPDQAFDVRLPAAPDVATIGRVREIAPQADAATRTRRIRLALSDPPAAFRLGTTITLSLTRTIEPKIDLPATALLHRGEGDFVWIVAPDGRSVHSRKIEVAGRTPARITVTAGLRAGERIVIAGVHSLTEDQPIAPEKPL
jgi:RND family efflux transporter MFP subunit